METENLSERKERILSSVIESYVETGEPVGSKTLSEQLGCSSATVRNEMAELAGLGLLEQPHTSAGRVPTQRGYRLYVNRLMTPRTLTDTEKRRVDSTLLSDAYDPQRLLESAARLLARATGYAAVSTTPSGSSAVVRALQVAQTGRRTAMVILMSSAGTVKNRIFHCDFDLSPEITRIFFRVLNEKLVGKPVAAITPALVQSVGASLGELSMMMSSVLRAVYEVATETVQTQVCLYGQTNLLFYPELPARRVMDFLERTTELTDFLQQEPGNTRVLIGAESGKTELERTGVIVSHYSIGGQEAGSIGVFGPMRMEYPRLIANMEYLAGTVGKLLTVLMKEE